MQLIVDIGSSQIKAGLIEEDQLAHTAVFKTPKELANSIQQRKIERALISSCDRDKTEELTVLLPGVPIKVLEPADFKKLGDLKPDQIANIFGALTIFPSNDCIIVDLGTTIRFDYISKQGLYLGGARFPTFDEIFQILEKTNFPDHTGQSPTPLGKDQLERSKSGCYYGLLGAIERIVSELRISSETPSGVMALATGADTASPELQSQLQDFIDIVDHHLTLKGLHQILKEEGKLS